MVGGLRRRRQGSRTTISNPVTQLWTSYSSSRKACVPPRSRAGGLLDSRNSTAAARLQEGCGVISGSGKREGLAEGRRASSPRPS
jgi:hypothetical protein